MVTRMLNWGRNMSEVEEKITVVMIDDDMFVPISKINEVIEDLRGDRDNANENGYYQSAEGIERAMEVIETKFEHYLVEDEPNESPKPMSEDTGKLIAGFLDFEQKVVAIHLDVS